MATLPPPQLEKLKNAAKNNAPTEIPEHFPNILCRFKALDGTCLPSTLIPSNISCTDMGMLLNKLLENNERIPYVFSAEIEGEIVEIKENIYFSIYHHNLKSTEDELTLIYIPQAIFRVRPINRCTATISGHGKPILCLQFSPKSGSYLSTGSGDGNVRIWDCDTGTPLHILKGHSNWVLCVSWSPDAKLLASGSMDNTIRLWDPKTGKNLGEPLKGHTKWITSLSWEPIHLAKNSLRFASSSKDTTIRIWDANLKRVVLTLSGHTSCVSCVKWGGNGWIYSASHDKSVKIWDGENGKLLYTLSAHAHWVNTMALSTDFVLRTGAYDYTGIEPSSFEEMKLMAKKKYDKIIASTGNKGERLITGSDDFTMYYWNPEESTKPVKRLTGHQNLVNHVSFSPDGQWIASASFDNSVKIWNGLTGEFITSFRGHVASVYQCSWSSDSRMLVSSSKDTTLKVWDIREKKLKCDLPGHSDEVFACDWSPDGTRVGSGGKDRSKRNSRQTNK
ncbi:uncharacterized protein T551_02803 [Pneumocystis jirovecii RU7]|uniref:Ribosome assembly protein 4 n=1 Tax=Pneumocystis jirovecii (strain RU7) TaxID=1408657 RepID=A0A0W4ZHK6_PNEJ7|nr:uncharacterized protein T551_02803 [Pneumocystis jirovecii RU7]KTW27836.1 hypothetical protein T551_02803 [Pneumocystis jirovecii RU7]